MKNKQMDSSGPLDYVPVNMHCVFKHAKYRISHGQNKTKTAKHRALNGKASNPKRRSIVIRWASGLFANYLTLTLHAEVSKIKAKNIFLDL